jgi:hypothetical protein
VADNTPVRTAGELLRAVQKRHPSLNQPTDWPDTSTVRNWFVFAGKHCAPRLPQPTQHFTVSFAACTDNRGAGDRARKPKLTGCEAAVADLKKQLQAARAAGVCVNTPLVDTMLVANMKLHNFEDKLSPHLLDPAAEPNPKLFRATADWITCFMSNELSMTRRAVTGDGGKLPDDWEEQAEQSLLRIVGKLQVNDIPRDRFFQADQTNAFIFSSSEYTFDVTGTKNVSGSDTDTKDSVTVMICNDGNGNMLPMLISVIGKTHGALDKFVSADPVFVRLGCILADIKTGCPPERSSAPQARLESQTARFAWF